MKKILLTLAVFLLSASGTYGATTLYEFYAQKGLKLPSISERGHLALEAGISPYSGSYEQNVALLDYLQSGNSEFLGGSNPMSATDWQLASAISANATTLTLVSINDVRGNTPDPADFATTTYLVIEPNSSSNIEIVACPRSGITTSTKTFANCTRGLGFYGSSETTVTANKKAHSAGARVIQSNVGQFYNLFVDKWDTNTLYGNYTFASTTASKVKVYLQNSGYYIWADTSTGAIGFSTSSNEYVWNESGTTFSAIRPLVLSGGNLTLATSTNDFKLDGSNNLAINASSTGGIASNANGVYVDGSDNYTWTGTHTFNATTTFTGDVSGVVTFFGDGSDGNVTLTTGTTTLTRDMYYNNLTIPADAELKPAGFKVYVRNTLSGSGLITSNGGNGGANGGLSDAGVAGTRPYTLGTLPIPVKPGAGGAGNQSAGSGSPGSNGINSGYGFLALAGANGGIGAANTGGAGAAGTGGATGTVVTTAKGIFENYYFTFATGTSSHAPLGLFTQAYGISSSAAGGGGAGDIAGGGNDGCGGGGGGAGGGVVWISARTISGVTIQAKGGNGGSSTTGTCYAMGGGGGGGNGGVIILFYNSSSTVTTAVTAGNGGTGNASGQAGQAGYVFNNDL